MASGHNTTKKLKKGLSKRMRGGEYKNNERWKSKKSKNDRQTGRQNEAF